MSVIWHLACAHRDLTPSVCLAALLAGLLWAPSAAAHAGSVAYWKVEVSGVEVRSQILVSLLDFGWTPSDLTTAEHGGAWTEARRLAIAHELLGHFVVRAGGQVIPATAVEARVLPPAMIEVTARHIMSATDATVPLTLRSTFHELTDDSHRVMARVERDGVSTPLVLDAVTPDQQIATVRRARAWHHALAPPGSLRAMLRLGIAHIVTGYDHILFLLCLLVPGGTWRSRIVTISAFTAAHSVTLVLAALHVVSLPARFVEVAIALSIAYVAIENLLNDTPRPRWPAAFGFGLIHGVGFAGMLDVLEMPMAQLVSSVLAFNLGVEIGQLAIVLVAVPVMALVARQSWHRPFVQVTSVVVCGLAGWWVVERLQ